MPGCANGPSAPRHRSTRCTRSTGIRGGNCWTSLGEPCDGQRLRNAAREVLILLIAWPRSSSLLREETHVRPLHTLLALVSAGLLLGLPDRTVGAEPA